MPCVLDHLTTQAPATRPRGPDRRAARPRAARGFLLVEVTVAIGLTIAIVLLALLVATQLYTARQNAFEQRALRLAAEGELARLRAGLPVTTQPATPSDASADPGPITVDIQSTPGTGPWQGFALVRVIAHRVTAGSSHQVELRAYVPQQSVVGLTPSREGPP